MGGGVGQILPDVFGHVAEHRGNGTSQVFDRDRQHRLTTPPPHRIRRADVQPILGDIQVEVRQIDGAEILHRLEEAEELKGLEGVGDIGKHLGHPVQHVAIELG